MFRQNMKNFICLLLLTAVLCSGLSSGLQETAKCMVPIATGILHSAITSDDGPEHSSICTEELLGRQPVLQDLRRGRQAYASLRLRIEVLLASTVLPHLYTAPFFYSRIPGFHPVVFSTIMIIPYIQQIDGKKSRFIFIPYIA